jgi:hypothetical protein
MMGIMLFMLCGCAATCMHMLCMLCITCVVTEVYSVAKVLALAGVEGSRHITLRYIPVQLCSNMLNTRSSDEAEPETGGTGSSCSSGKALWLVHHPAGGGWGCVVTPVWRFVWCAGVAALHLKIVWH